MKRLLSLSRAAYPFLLLLLPFQFIPMMLPSTVRIIPAVSNLAVALILLLFCLRLLDVTARRATVRPYLFVGFAGACAVGLDAFFLTLACIADIFQPMFLALVGFASWIGMILLLVFFWRLGKLLPRGPMRSCARTTAWLPLLLPIIVSAVATPLSFDFTDGQEAYNLFRTAASAVGSILFIGPYAWFFATFCKYLKQ